MSQTVLRCCQWNQHIWLIEAKLVSKIIEINDETYLLYIVLERQK
jgi:hypothetical protein